MKRILRLLACLLMLTATVKAETLNNDSVIQLHKLGLGDSTIVAKIKTSTCTFDTSMDSLKALKDAGISDEVIQAMLFVMAPPVTAAPSAAPVDPNNPKAPHQSGIYLYQEIDGKPNMTVMSTSRADIKTDGVGVPFGNVRNHAVLFGPQASLQLTETQPVFYFYFDKAQAGLGSADRSATTPDDFDLAELEAHKYKEGPTRRLETSKAGMGGFHAGLSKKVIRPITSEKIADGVFKVIPATSLKPGEYAFVQMMTGYSIGNLKMFDFGIAGGSK